MIWFISDTHFGHEKCCTEFKRPDGSPLRPFSCAEEMDETMVERWNANVKPQDKVYHCGDVTIHERFLPILGRLNGSKRLVRGNHDIFRTKKYMEYFKEIYGVRVFPEYELVLSHVPLHGVCVDRFKFNVHGHMHDKLVPTELPYEELDGPGGSAGYRTFYKTGPDPRYINVCVEHTNYTPISLDEVMARKESNG